MKREKYPLSPYGIDMYLYAVEDSIVKQFHRFNYPYSVSCAISPLRWYISTGRASAQWIRSMLSVRPDIVARRLLKGGTDLEVIERLNALIEGKYSQ